jgi:hypothetical protein
LWLFPKLRVLAGVRMHLESRGRNPDWLQELEDRVREGQL